MHFYAKCLKGIWRISNVVHIILDCIFFYFVNHQSYSKTFNKVFSVIRRSFIIDSQKLITSLDETIFYWRSMYGTSL